MEKPIENKSNMFQRTEDVFKSLGAGISETAKQKIKDYVARINAGESKESVLSGIGKQSVFRKGVEAILKDQEQEKGKKNTQDYEAKMKAEDLEQAKKIQEEEIKLDEYNEDVIKNDEENEESKKIMEELGEVKTKNPSKLVKKEKKLINKTDEEDDHKEYDGYLKTKERENTLDAGKVVKSIVNHLENKEKNKKIKEIEAKEKEAEVKKVEIEIKATIIESDKKKDDVEIKDQLKSVGLNADDLKNDKVWEGLTKAEKLLVLEQAQQDTLSHVKEIGEKRFQEKNAIKLSWNPLNLRPSFFAKIYNKIGKSYWISKEEKEVIKEVETGKQKPDPKTLDSLIKRLGDLKNDFNLNVIEKNGKAFIEFATGDKNLSKEDKILIDKYNEQANTFSKMPDSWNNERAAKSTDKMFTKENHTKYLEVKAKYEVERSNLIESKAKQYEESGLSRSESKSKAMTDVKNMDNQIAMLQLTNTNPDALEELNKIKNESSWGRLLNNENIWRAIYMGAGYGARSVSTALGFLAAPVVSGAIGGIRARRKANDNVNTAFRVGTEEETFLERKAQGKKGIFDDKNKEQGFIADVFSGQKVNTKEVAAFVDADSQKQRIDNLINKINNTENDREKASLLSRLLARIEYIELKQQQGLINYGNKNPIGKNYELFKSLSVAYVATTNINNLGIEMTREMKEDILEREKLLQSVMARNERAFGTKIAEYKNNEMLRGAAVAAGFAVLGAILREWMHGDIETTRSTNEISSARQHEINEVLIKSHDEVPATAVAKNGDGGIVLARRLQKALTLKYGADLSKAPESVKHILNTDADKLAREFEMYKPNQDAESALIHPGDSITEKNGEITFHDKLGGKEINLMKGNDIKPINTYDGKMSDTDHSGFKTPASNTEESSGDYKLPPQVNPITGESMETPSDPTNIVDNPYKVPPQVNPVTGLPMPPQADASNITDGSYKVPAQVNPISGEKINPAAYILNSQENLVNDGSQLLEKVNTNLQENLHHIFPTEKLMETYDYIKANVSAEKLIALDRGEGVADAYKPLVSYLDKLEEVSGIKPIGQSLINEAESISDYMLRASKKVAEMGKLDEIKF